jgi:hypothetical protein
MLFESPIGTFLAWTYPAYQWPEEVPSEVLPTIFTEFETHGSPPLRFWFYPQTGERVLKL